MLAFDGLFIKFVVELIDSLFELINRLFELNERILVDTFEI
jgi:hypothetical protein